MYDEKLVIDNVNLIYLVLKRLHLLDKQEEYFDIGMIGLVKGAITYDVTKNIKPSTYLYRCVYNEICCYFQRLKEPKDKISLSTEIYREKGETPILLEDTISSDVNIEEEILLKEQKERLYKQIAKLSEIEKIIICLNYGIGNCEKKTEREIGKILNISQAHVNRIKNKTVEKLRNNLKLEEI